MSPQQFEYLQSQVLQLTAKQLKILMVEIEGKLGKKESAKAQLSEEELAFISNLF